MKHLQAKKLSPSAQATMVLDKFNSSLMSIKEYLSSLGKKASKKVDKTFLPPRYVISSDDVEVRVYICCEKTIDNGDDTHDIGSDEKSSLNITVRYKEQGVKTNKWEADAFIPAILNGEMYKWFVDIITESISGDASVDDLPVDQVKLMSYIKLDKVIKDTESSGTKRAQEVVKFLEHVKKYYVDDISPYNQKVNVYNDMISSKLDDNEKQSVQSFFYSKDENEEGYKRFFAFRIIIDKDNNRKISDNHLLSFGVGEFKKSDFKYYNDTKDSLSKTYKEAISKFDKVIE